MPFCLVWECRLRNDSSAVFDHIPGDGRVLCGRDAGKGRGDDADGRHAESERRTVTGRIDAEGWAAHDHRIRHPVCQFADQPVGHLLPVRSHPTRADHRKRRLAERFRGTQNIQHMRVVGGFAQQGRVLCVGGGDDLDPVFAAMFDFALCVCERFLLEDRPREFRSESGFSMSSSAEAEKTASAEPNTSSRWTAPFGPIPGVRVRAMSGISRFIFRIRQSPNEFGSASLGETVGSGPASGLRLAVVKIGFCR